MENDLSHKSFLYDLLRTMVRTIPFKGWVIIVGIVFGVPTSYYGVQWMLYKTAKQDLNCYSDLNITKSGTTDPYQYMDQIDAQIKGYLSCIQRVDTEIGTVEFIREEIKRL